MTGNGSDRPDRFVQYRKWDGSLHWRHDMILLGEDEHGIWLGAPRESVVRKGHQPPTRLPWAFAQLIRPHDRWTAIFNLGSEKYEVYVDIITPAVWVDEQTVEMVDMDLDVVRRVGGAIEVLDEDEFADHRQLFQYPESLVTETEQATEQVRELLESGAEPFANRYRHWFGFI